MEKELGWQLGKQNWKKDIIWNLQPHWQICYFLGNPILSRIGEQWGTLLFVGSHQITDILY